jgi:hypothetical protein
MYKVGRAALALFCSVMLLVPVAVLLVAPLSDWASLGVIISFAALLVTVLSLKGVLLDQMLIILSAYIAVLSALLSNLSQGTRR